jgi:hypothetical protein
MKLNVTAFGILLFNFMPLRIMTFSKMILNMMTFYIIASQDNETQHLRLRILRLSMLRLSILRLSTLRLSTLRLSTLRLSTLRLSTLRLRILRLSKMTLSIMILNNSGTHHNAKMTLSEDRSVNYDLKVRCKSQPTFTIVNYDRNTFMHQTMVIWSLSQNNCFLCSLYFNWL